MTWQLALQGVLTVFSGIGLWFMYDFVREMKAHKDATRQDISALKLERETFKNTVRSAELSMGERVGELRKTQNEFSVLVKSGLGNMSLDVERIRDSIHQATKDSENFKKFLQKLLIVTKHHEKEINTLKVQIKDVTIFKSK